jgi:uncharacterized LabA/DUF88 family protein
MVTKTCSPHTRGSFEEIVAFPKSKEGVWVSATESNYAFIDGQNLHLATTQAAAPWKISHHRFKTYLAEKYCVSKAYYFLGAYNPEYQGLYKAIEQHGFILVFREHGAMQTGKKKGNVDVDIVFSIMRKLYERESFQKVVLVSGDGDYKRMVDYLIKIGKFRVILLPSKEYASSLYKSLTGTYYAYLDTPDMRAKLELEPK